MFDPTIFDRAAMGFSLGVHILLVMFGVTMPVMILIADYLWIRNGDKVYKTISNRLSTAFAILFAVGTASGTLVAIELLVLWPKFMALVGQVAISPVNAEVFVFFTEAIFLTTYLLYKDVFSDKRVRLALMLVVAIAAAASGAFITLLNSFMNTPVGFNIPAYLNNGTVIGIQPFAVFTAPAAAIEVPHVLATTYFAGSAVLMAYFAFMLLRTDDMKKKEYYSKVLKLAFAVCLVAVVFAIITGILSIEGLYNLQPEKYAAIELNLNPVSNAPEIIGGTIANGTLQGVILSIPGLQSVLATGSTSGTVPGLSQFAQSTWPPLFVHTLFDIMVILGFAMGGFLILLFALYMLRVRVLEMKPVQVLLILLGVAATLVIEFGWIVDEVGRQPWIIYNVMTVSQAANQSPSIVILALLIILIYAIILPITYLVIRRVFAKRPLEKEL